MITLGVALLGIVVFAAVLVVGFCLAVGFWMSWSSGQLDEDGP